MLGAMTRRRILKLFSLGTWAAVLSGCASTTQQASPTAAKPAESKPAAQAATAAPAQAATTAPAQGTTAAPGQVQTITLKMQSTWPTQDIFHEVFIDLGKKVEAMSGGRLKFEILPSGAVVPAFQLIDAVHQGVLDGGHGVPAYWFGKHRAASLFGTGPSFGMNAEMLLAWIYYGGGQELYNELIQKTLGLNVQSFFHGPMPTQPLGWFKEPIQGPESFRGLKYRTVGLSADLFTELGASVVILSGGEIVRALERGVIDGAEFNNTSSDRLLGFPDVRKVLMAQSYHQPVEFLELLINKQKYDALPQDLKEIIRYANMAQSADFTWKMIDRNSTDLKEMKEKQGVQVIKTPKSVLEAQLQAWDKIIDKESKASPEFAKIVQSQRDWAARVVPWYQEIMVENETAFQHYFQR